MSLYRPSDIPGVIEVGLLISMVFMFLLPIPPMENCSGSKICVIPVADPVKLLDFIRLLH